MFKLINNDTVEFKDMVFTQTFTFNNLWHNSVTKRYEEGVNIFYERQENPISYFTKVKYIGMFHFLGFDCNEELSENSFKHIFNIEGTDVWRANSARFVVSYNKQTVLSYCRHFMNNSRLYL